MSGLILNYNLRKAQKINDFLQCHFPCNIIVFYDIFSKSRALDNISYKKFQMNELASSMESTYSTAKICNHGEDLSSCEPSLSLGGKSCLINYLNLLVE